MTLPQNKKKKSSEVFLKKIFMASNYFSNHLYFLKELKKVLLKKYEIQMVVRRNIETKLIAQCIVNSLLKSIKTTTSKFQSQLISNFCLNIFIKKN